MTHNMIVILDLGSTQSAQIARDIRALGLYSEIHPNDIAPAALKALPGIVGVILNGGENRAVNGVPVEVDPAIYDLGLPILSVDYACAGHPADLPAWPENTRETLDAFIEGLGVERNWSMDSFIADQVELLRKQIGSRKVLLALSGGVDSSVVAALLLKAVGDQLTCVHVNHGLLRKGEPEQVVRVFKQEMGANLIYVDAVDRFLDKLAGVSDPEQKRKIIGAEFIRVFEEEARKLEGIEFLAQGTIYPDIVESHGVKAHHNVGGLPDDLKFDLVEPLRLLFKDEVRQVGAALGLPDSMVYRQPFPGPGLGVRCLGAITRDRLAALRESDAILREEFDRAGLTSQVWQFFTIVPDMRSTGVRDGARVFDWPVIIRAVNTVDAMTATVPELPWALLKRVTDRVLSEVPGVCRVLYDLSPKPVGTIEWE